MAFITLTTFVDGLEALVVAGVDRQYTQGPPAQPPTTADLPVSFVYKPRVVGATGLTFANQGGRGSLAAQYIILVQFVAQNRQGPNHDDTVAMVDALEAALIAAGCGIGGRLGWSIVVTNHAVAEMMYWAVVADITGGRFS